MKPFLKAVKSIASRFRLARRSTAALPSGLTLNNSLTAKPDILARFFQAVQQRVFTLCRPTQPRHRPRHLEKHTQATKERDYTPKPERVPQRLPALLAGTSARLHAQPVLVLKPPGFLGDFHGAPYARGYADVLQQVVVEMRQLGGSAVARAAGGDRLPPGGHRRPYRRGCRRGCARQACFTGGHKTLLAGKRLRLHDESPHQVGLLVSLHAQQPGENRIVLYILVSYANQHE